MMRFAPSVLCVWIMITLASIAHAQFASTVIAWDRGGNTNDYDDPNAVLGSPERWTPNWMGGADDPVTIFNPPWGYDAPDDTGTWPHDQIFSFSPGGIIEVRFDLPVDDDPLNPFGIDLIIFGNAAFVSADWPATTCTDPAALLGADSGAIAVSQDGLSWVTVSPPYADALYPTTGWADAAHSMPSDFRRPVDPSLMLSAFDGLTEAQVLALYAGSGGGTGIDLAGTGLGWIQYIRVTNTSGEPDVDVEIDAFADVRAIPEPGLALLGAVALVFGLRRRTKA